jgi:transcription elongation factor GreA
MYNELTPDDIKKMEEEIEYRVHVVRKEALEDVKTARAHGDLSENFEYHAAKREKNRNESRIRYLQKMIKTAKVIDDTSADDEVGINNRVELFYEDDETTEVIKLVTTVRGDSLEGLISIESPLGKALLGHKAGDRVLIEVNQDVQYYVTIKSIDKNADSDDKIQPF